MSEIVSLCVCENVCMSVYLYVCECECVGVGVCECVKLCVSVCVSVCVCPCTSTRLIQTPEKQTPTFMVSLTLGSLAVPLGSRPLMHRPENIPPSIWARQRRTACAPINALTLHICSWPFSLSGEPQRRTGSGSLSAWLPASPACHSVEGAGGGEGQPRGWGGGERPEGDRKGA